MGPRIFACVVAFAVFCCKDVVAQALHTLAIFGIHDEHPLLFRDIILVVTRRVAIHKALLQAVGYSHFGDGLGIGGDSSVWARAL